MDDNYLYLKLLHVVVAVVALGTSAGLGIVLELYGDDSTHGSFVLRVIERMVLLVVVPGYVLMLATGLWMVHLAWSFTAKWIQVALGLWAVWSSQSWMVTRNPTKATEPARYRRVRIHAVGVPPSQVGSQVARSGSSLSPSST